MLCLYTNTSTIITADDAGELATALSTAGNVYISSVTFRVYDPATTGSTGAYIDYTFNPGYSLSVK